MKNHPGAGILYGKPTLVEFNGNRVITSKLANKNKIFDKYKGVDNEGEEVCPTWVIGSEDPSPTVMRCREHCGYTSWTSPTLFFMDISLSRCSASSPPALSTPLIRITCLYSPALYMA